MIINLNSIFPEPGPSKRRGPLPKQADFLREALNSAGAKYILYAGGVGSGKSLIGCITMISLAVQYPGDYLIARQFLPELKLTTYKTFLELCPKELILEHRIADGIVKLRSAGGKVANIIFRGLDEPDKHRSLNLNAAYIDESSQVSEAAFVVLQSRLRGPHVRKIFLTTNVAGHDWQHHLFIKQDGMNDQAKKLFKLIHAPSTENIHLPEGYVESMLQTYTEDKIQREIYANWDSFAGQIYSEFRRDIHVIQPFAIPIQWTRVIGCDHGFRNASAWIWAAVDYDENLYVYREFYEREWLIEEICKGHPKENKPGVVKLMKGEKIEQARMDPSTRAVRGQSGLSDWDTYLEHLPKDFPLLPANNEVSAGIDRVKTFLKVNARTNKPKLFIFNTCTNLLDEFAKYRWKELSIAQTGKTNEKEEPVKVNDHAMDALRYLVMSRPEPPKEAHDRWSKIPYNSLTGAVIRDLESIKKPKSSDPWGE
jgi:phage terminase large subunit